MRPLLYFFAFFLLLACGELTNNDFFGNKNKGDSTEISEASSTKKDSVIYAENVSPDGSWQINFNLKEGYFWGYTVVIVLGELLLKKLIQKLN